MKLSDNDVPLFFVLLGWLSITLGIILKHENSFHDISLALVSGGLSVYTNQLTKGKN